MKIEIEKNVPIPKPKRKYYHGGGYNSTEFTNTLRTMEVGDSFITDKSKSGVSSSVSRIGRELNKKYTIRKIGEHIRIWRVK